MWLKNWYFFHDNLNSIYQLVSKAKLKKNWVTKRIKLKLSSSVLYMPILRGLCEISMKFKKSEYFVILGLQATQISFKVVDSGVLWFLELGTRLFKFSAPAKVIRK